MNLSLMIRDTCGRFSVVGHPKASGNEGIAVWRMRI